MNDQVGTTKQALAMLCLLAITLLGCKALQKRIGAQAAASASAAVAAAPSASIAAAPAPPPPVTKNPRVLDLVDQIRLFCHYSAQGTFDRCARDPVHSGARVAETDLLHDPSFVETLSVVLIEEKNPRLVLAAAELLARSEFHVYSGLDSSRNPKADSFVSKATAERLLEALRSVPQATVAARPIVWIATARALTNEVIEVLNKLPGDPAKAAEARRLGMASLLEFGGLPVFEQVKALAASGNPEDAAAAAHAVMQLRKPGPAERAVVCPWLKELLNDDSERVSSAAATSILYVCHDDFSALLENFDKRVAAVSVTQSTLRPFQSVCRRPNPDAKPRPEDSLKPATPGGAQCEAMFALVQKVVDDKRFDQLAREIGFGILSERVNEETLRVCTAWKDKKRSEDFRIPEAASKCVKEVRAAMQQAKAGK